MAEQRLIDANAILYVEAVDGDTFEGTGKFYARKKDIDALPTIEERKTGKWEHGRETSRTYLGKTLVKIWYEDWRCNTCGIVVECSEKPAYKFCPNCGADMREQP